MEKKTVLIVDDSPISLKHAQSILKDCFATACTKSGQRALDYLSDHTPDLILLDVKMPEMSGIELFGRIKESQKHANIPVVFLTGDEDGAVSGLGAHRVMRKPAEPEELLKVALELTEKPLG